MLKAMAAGGATVALSACAMPAATDTGAAGDMPAMEEITIGWARHGSEGDVPTETGLADYSSRRIPA